MDQNTSAINALREYVKIVNPRYAFMIEAPWGAGKTYLVKHEFSALLSSDKARYISLNGVSDRKAFRRALLVDTSEAKLTDAAGKFGDALGRMAKLGNVGSLVQDKIEDRLIKNLPDILIFDDIERCEMSPEELLGLINEFVEHQAKKVILCAFIERDHDDDENEEAKKRDNFLSRKEKVVGRTVKIVADAPNALPKFISTMPDSEGKKWFQSNDALVLEVFSVETHKNLRVLRQCMHDCGRVIDVLEEDLRVSTDAMTRFVRTYLVLSMALVTGEINLNQLGQRSDYRCILKPDKGEKPHPLFNCLERHPQAEIFAGDAASIVPMDLGISLIGIGYEEPERINEALRSTGQFTGNPDVPLWARFVKWREMPKDDLESTYQEAWSYIFECDEIKPGPFLILANDIVTIAKDGFENEEEIARKIKDRIESLAKAEKIPAADYGEAYGWSASPGTFSFGGYAFKLDKTTQPLIDTMKSVQITAFTNSRAMEAARIFGLFIGNLESFGREFSWNDSGVGYNKTEILHEIDAGEFANAIFDYMRSDQLEDVGTQLRELADRCQSNSMPKELAWANKVKAELLILGNNDGPLEKARMIWFLDIFWKFPTEDESSV